ncbi:MAG: phosphoglycolate phosphatase [Neisseria sp.]|nr:phosphoglycolate phosphatase [Neisseria sp.]
MTQKFADIQAVAFDLDGTLVDSVADLANSANAMRAALAMPPLPQEVLLSFIGDGMARLVHRALCGDHHSLADEALWARGFDLFVRHYALHLTDLTRPYPQVRDTLALLKTLHLPLVVITNKNERFARDILKNLELADEFSLLIGGDTLPEKKPSALPLLHTCQVLNIAPENLLMVGDSRNDILAARAAGAAVIGVTFGYGDMAALDADAATRPDATVSAFVEIYRLLRDAREQA